MGFFDFALKMAEADGSKGRRTIALNKITLAGGVGLGDLANGIESLIDVFKNPNNHIPLTLTGGLTLTEYRELYLKAMQVYAKKHFYAIRVVDNDIRANMGNIDTNVFNYLAIDVSYSDTVLGQQKSIGSYQSDQVTGLERRQVRITFLDTHDGIVERFLKFKKDSMFNKDGTINPPDKYAFGLGIHKIDIETGKPYLSEGMLVRIESIEYDLNRRDMGLTELPVTFVELDKFI